MFNYLKTRFFYGLVIVLPSVATVWVLSFLIKLVSGPANTLIGRRIPLLASFLLTLIVVTVIGIVARHYIGVTALKYFEGLLGRIPMINVIYRSIKQIIEAITSNKKLFSAGALVQYPREGVWSLGFLTQENPILHNKDGENVVEGKCCVYIVMTPNPTGGFFIYVDRKEIIVLKQSVEECFKIIMSAGVLTPTQRAKLKPEKIKP